eukprot:TRINITY_DN2855_c0_g1_i3.p1 TRINITY_DN2855_c0_g1~~TRINITY_DN2855_c0_g1_i3.p1  ORF type:complete len:302 (-),score=126.71 TRINITY_DN2855_c0_g1_i3:171-1076(-)
MYIQGQGQGQGQTQGQFFQGQGQGQATPTTPMAVQSSAPTVTLLSTSPQVSSSNFFAGQPNQFAPQFPAQFSQSSPAQFSSFTTDPFVSFDSQQQQQQQQQQQPRYQRRVRGTNSEMETLNQQFSKLSTTESSQTVRVDVTSEVTHLKFDVCHEVLGMVTIKAPFCENLETQRAPLDLVAVLDQSGSMSGDKIEMVKNSMMFAISQLKTDDRLAIVLFETEVQVLFELKFMDAKNKQEATDLIKLISTKNMTALAGGLFQGLDLLIKDQETTTTTTTTTYNNNNNNNNNNNFNNLLSSIGQ